MHMPALLSTLTVLIGIASHVFADAGPAQQLFEQTLVAVTLMTVLAMLTPGEPQGAPQE